MKDKINVEEIFKKHTGHKFNDSTTQLFKAAIKEIIEDVIDWCAEEAVGEYLTPEEAKKLIKYE